MKWVASIKLQAKAGIDVMALRDQVAELMSTNVAREEILAGLNGLKVEFRGSSDDEAEDIINDLLDFIVGWCRPELRL